MTLEIYSTKNKNRAARKLILAAHHSKMEPLRESDTTKIFWINRI